jgi:hypothetical protein
MGYVQGLEERPKCLEIGEFEPNLPDVLSQVGQREQPVEQQEKGKQ